MPRPSPVRDVIRRLLSTDAKHAWSLDELLDEVRLRTGSADYSSVFRCMVALEREGSVRRLDIGDGRARFEPSEAHHEHISCVACGRVAEVPGCLIDDAAEAIAAKTGYRVVDHTLVFTGVCAACASS